MVTHSRRRLVHVQVSNAHGWHGARNMARANEQQKQQQQQQKQQKQKQRQKQKQKQKQKQDLKQQQNGGGETGALSVDGVEVRIPAICAHSLLYITVCWLSLLLTAGPLCVGRTVGRVGEGQARCEYA